MNFTGYTDSVLVFSDDSQGYTAINKDGVPVFIKTLECSKQEYSDEAERFIVASKYRLAPILYDHLFYQGRCMFVTERLAETLEHALKS